MLPWDHLDSGLDKDWLWEDWQDAVARVRAGRLPVDPLLRLRRLPVDGHRDPDRPDRQEAAAADPGQPRPSMTRPGARPSTSTCPTRGREIRPVRSEDTIAKKPQPEGGQAPVVQRDPDPLRQARAAAVHLAPRLRPRVRAGAAPGRRADRLLAGLHPAPEDLLRQRRADRRGQRGRVPGDRAPGGGRPGRAACRAGRRALARGWTCSTPWSPTGGSLADRIDASHWRIELPEVTPETLRAAVDGVPRAPTRCWSSG